MHLIIILTRNSKWKSLRCGPFFPLWLQLIPALSFLKCERSELSLQYLINVHFSYQPFVEPTRLLGTWFHLINVHLQLSSFLTIYTFISYMVSSNKCASTISNSLKDLHVYWYLVSSNKRAFTISINFSKNLHVY